MYTKVSMKGAILMTRDTEITIPDSYVEDLIEQGYRFIFLTSNCGYTVEILVVKDGECEDRTVEFMFSEVMQGREYMYEKIALEARELIKIKVLQNCDQSAKEIAEIIAQNVGCDVVQVIGNKIVLFKVSSKDKIKHILI